MQETLDTSNLAEYRLRVVDVTLIKDAGNKYTGVAAIKPPEHAAHDVVVRVTYDGEQGMWEVDQGAFAWAHDLLG